MAQGAATRTTQHAATNGLLIAILSAAGPQIALCLTTRRNARTSSEAIWCLFLSEKNGRIDSLKIKSIIPIVNPFKQIKKQLEK
jgi:hypothetical protein